MKLLRKWFTLVELLIAIIIFGIGVVAIMETVIQNIRQAQQVKEMMTMTMLAKEWVELVYNRKDTNSLRGLDWDCIDSMSPTCNTFDLLSIGPTFNYYTASIGLDPAIPNQKTDLYSFSKKSLSLSVDELKKKIHKWENIDFALYKHENIQGLPFLYSHKDTDTSLNPLVPSNFHRYIRFEPAHNEWDSWFADTSKLLKMTVTVISKSPWMWGDRPFELETFIWNY